ncbi:putative phage replisome organizer [Clostridium beijerinckii]|nr:putative phage replisome organizer [Clostridium beijerinckii]NYB97877.1 putative phage replisome organizer [Clostridium beijerinckii]
MMADIKWIKLATGMPDDEKMRLIDALPERDTVHYLWIRLLIQAAKTNSDGEIFLSEDIPYTDKMLSVLFSRPLASIKLALKTLSRLGMIEISLDKIIRIVNWDKHQNIEGMERVREQNRKRAENHREKKKLEQKATKSNNEEVYENEVTEEDKDLNENQALENNEEASTNSIGDNNTNNFTDNAGSNNTVETADSNFEVTKNTCNVMQNESNVTVTEQNKKEIENKKKNKKEKREIQTKRKNSICEINNKSSTCEEEESQSNPFENYNTKTETVVEEEINTKALELMRYHEKITGKVGGCDYVSLRSAINIHGDKRVKMAMDIGFEKNCPEIKYAIGILKNWRRDGYPKDDMEGKINGVRSTGKNNSADKNEFAGFKPKEPRKLTEEQRKRAEANLI